jgi:hypothetical protein
MYTVALVAPAGTVHEPEAVKVTVVCALVYKLQKKVNTRQANTSLMLFVIIEETVISVGEDKTCFIIGFLRSVFFYFLICYLASE